MHLFRFLVFWDIDEQHQIIVYMSKSPRDYFALLVFYPRTSFLYFPYWSNSSGNTVTRLLEEEDANDFFECGYDDRVSPAQGCDFSVVCSDILLYDEEPILEQLEDSTPVVEVASPGVFNRESGDKVDWVEQDVWNGIEWVVQRLIVFSDDRFASCWDKSAECDNTAADCNWGSVVKDSGG